MSQELLDIYHASPLEVGEIELKDEFFEYDSVAVFYKDTPIILMGLSSDIDASIKASSFINSHSFTKILNRILGGNEQPITGITSNRITTKVGICIRDKEKKDVHIILPIQEQVAKVLATLICLDPELTNFLSK